MSIDSKLKASIYSGLVEVIATHPLDYAKTLLQNNNNSITLSQFLKNPYKGLLTRIIGIVPMRILFWNSIDYFKSNGYHPVMAGLYTACIQTTIDYPIEQIKIQKMIHNKISFFKPGLIPGFTFTLLRNSGFAIILNSILSHDPNSYYLGAVGGFLGAIITHPLDSLKTHYQSGNSIYPKHWTFNDYYKGWYFRAGISLVSMNIGWIIYNKLK